MIERILSPELLSSFREELLREERAAGTAEKYRRDLLALQTWLNGRPLTKEAANGWKEHLVASGYAPATVNSMLAAANAFFRFAGWDDCRLKFLKLQHRMFRDQSRELTKEEYLRLLETAKAHGQERLALLMETICSTGIRVSELRYITAEAARSGKAEISLKGKIRTILLPDKLCRKLLKYAGRKKIVSGEIFLTGNGTSLSRRQIWAEMKGLCCYCGVSAAKVFPHNLRHLFATSFYRICRDIVRLADVLGHSSIETTRIYLLTTGEEHRRQLDQLRLIT